MKILVVGGAGYIGSHFVLEASKKGNEVTVFDDLSSGFKSNLNDNIFTTINKPTTQEQIYYRYLFNKHYKGCDHLIEYFWMPKYVNAKDASARTLNCYNENNTNNIIASAI